MPSDTEQGAAAVDTTKDSSRVVAPPPGESRMKRASSLFRGARQSFYRSGGKRGASIEHLRGTTGADFEAVGRINRTGEIVVCGCFGSSSDNSDLVILIKGPFLFVYASETSSSPKYAISLKSLQAKKKSAEHGRHPVIIETSLGDPQYELSFTEADVATRFTNVVKTQAAYADKVEIRKKLGHDHLLNRRASVKFAEQVATEKCKDAPPKPDADIGLDQQLFL